jgi:hypothetical protein
MVPAATAASVLKRSFSVITKILSHADERTRCTPAHGAPSPNMPFAPLVDNPVD